MRRRDDPENASARVIQTFSRTRAHAEVAEHAELFCLPTWDAGRITEGVDVDAPKSQPSMVALSDCTCRGGLDEQRGGWGILWMIWRSGRSPQGRFLDWELPISGVGPFHMPMPGDT